MSRQSSAVDSVLVDAPFTPSIDSSPSGSLARDQGVSFWRHWLSAPLLWIPWNYTWWAFLNDARHGPAIIMLGHAWTWSWAIPYIQFPLGFATGLWLIKVLNVTWSSMWASVGYLVGGAATCLFTALGDFSDQSVYFRLFCIVIGLYVMLMFVGACGLTLFRGILRSIQRMCKAWPFEAPTLSSPSHASVPLPPSVAVNSAGNSDSEECLRAADALSRDSPKIPLGVCFAST